jgi:hypothetical protein
MSKTTFKITSKLLLSSPNNYKSCKYVSCIALFFMKCNLTTWNGFKPMSNVNVKSCEFLHVAYTRIRQMSAWKSIGWIYKHLANTNTSTSHDQEGNDSYEYEKLFATNIKTTIVMKRGTTKVIFNCKIVAMKT